VGVPCGDGEREDEVVVPAAARVEGHVPGIGVLRLEML
jgi:hypothetical protein